ncbi:hypothetical protein, partial [Pseudofrankia sp. BMG5.36]|uniref:hypothetical protein n=1 Tax=Pseudofrankia sp. BMG5.36 TaxID=1834512 RepID=UPI001A7E0AF4
SWLSRTDGFPGDLDLVVACRVSGLVPGRRDHVDFSVWPPIAIPIDVLGDGDLKIGMARLRPLVMDQLSFEDRIERLRRRVAGITDRAHRRDSRRLGAIRRPDSLTRTSPSWRCFSLHFTQ